MGDIKSLPSNVIFFSTLSCFSVLLVQGTPLYSTPYVKTDPSEESQNYRNIQKSYAESNCTLEEYELKDVVIFENKDLFLKPKNVTLISRDYRKEGQKILICFADVDHSDTSLNCPNGKFLFDNSKYTILSNGSADLFGEIIPKGDYEIVSTQLLICYEVDGAQISTSEWRMQSKFIVPRFSDVHLGQMPLNCTNGRIGFNNSEYTILSNGSADLFGDILPNSEYEINGTELFICAGDYHKGGHSTSESKLGNISLLVGEIGSGISITALSCYLIIFALLPALRNLPGYNLASLSAAFLLGYSFLLIGHIKENLGLPCIISAILSQYFFLTAFFCMNVMSFDVWRTLKLSTEKLVIGSQNTGNRQFLWYSLYAWGCPLVITAISVVFDIAKGIPDIIKPYYGKVGPVCLSASKYAKSLFFAAPAFTLLITNIYFFARSFYMISSNTLKRRNDLSEQSVKLNYVLYVRLALMMGLTYLIGAVGWISQEISENMIVWFIFDTVNSLQGLFLFLFLTCRKRVIKHLKSKANSIRNWIERNATYATQCSDSNNK